MTDKRAALRQRTFKGGSISLPSGIIDCIIRNLSDTGALVELAGPFSIPDTFTLIIKPEILKRSCVIAWRRGHQIGVHFQVGQPCSRQK